MRRVQLPVVLSGILFFTSACGRVEPKNVIAERIDALMSTLHDQGHFNGAIVVGRDGEILYERGFGLANVEAEIPFTPDSPANIASIAKTLTSAAVMMLVAEGRIELDAPVTQYLAEFPYRQVTIRHLLSHTSGLSTSYFAGVDPTGVTAANELILSILADRKPTLSFVPGSAFQYSNAAFDLLALLVERVSGDSFATFLGQRVFEPLDMRSAFIVPVLLENWDDRRTRSYRPGENGLVRFEEDDNRGQYGSHGIYASARDIYRWASSFYATPVLGEAALAASHETPMLESNQRAPINLLSWYSANDGARHYFTGVEAGFYSFAYWDADRRHSIAFVSNLRSLGWVPQLLENALIDIVEGRSPGSVGIPVNMAELVALPPGNASAQELGSLTGSYRLSSRDVVTISARENTDEPQFGSPLSVRVNDGPAFNAFPGGPDIYVVPLDASVLLTEVGGERTLHWIRVFEGVTRGTREDR